MKNEHYDKGLSDHPSQTPETLSLLRGQKAIVTGASSGIGRTIAIMLADAGADVCVNYSSGEKRASEVAEKIGQSGSGAFTFRADVSNEKDVIAMFNAARERFGAVDIVVCNAGVQKDRNDSLPRL